MNSHTVVVVSGGYDPVHSGHIALFNEAKKLGDVMVAGVNSDAWLIRKKGQAFMPWLERSNIVSNLKSVDLALAFNDNDGTACDLLYQVKELYPNSRIIFANGGDRTKENIPEMTVPEVEFAFGVGGENKANSSSWILEEWKAPKTVRQWGYYRVLHEVGAQVKVKELTVDPGKTLSMQRHSHRAELWFVAEGEATLNWEFGGEKIKLHRQQTINVGEWHQLHNPTDRPLRVIEIQYGTECVEEDILRK
jgi:cytidyltransferase-like protein